MIAISDIILALVGLLDRQGAKLEKIALFTDAAVERANHPTVTEQWGELLGKLEAMDTEDLQVLEILKKPIEAIANNEFAVVEVKGVFFALCNCPACRKAREGARDISQLN